MRFIRLPFGNTSSPWLLNATLQHHLSKYEKTDVIQSLKSDMFVDNWVSGAQSIDQAYERYCEAVKVLADAQMPLVKWYTNDESLQNIFSDSNSDQEKVISVLGVS